jgi:hypothetical protein
MAHDLDGVSVDHFHHLSLEINRTGRGDKDCEKKN